jgi:trans-2,3-dihydro-3-hydroxyanthranilate isomerase
VVAECDYFICDVFAEERFGGNQLAVVPDASRVPEALLQPIAREFNFSETVFCYPPARSGDADVHLRIFTPAVELAFAGHPVLGAAALLAKGRSPLRLATGSGVVPVEVEETGRARWRAGMSQPLARISLLPDPGGVLAALGVRRSRLPVEVYDLGIRHLYVALDRDEDLAGLRPDMAALAEAAGDVGVNCFSGSGSNWRTRMFGPGLGVPEDPATGSAAGPLALHLCRHGWVPWGTPVEIVQGIELGRPSRLSARAEGGHGGARAVTVAGTVIGWAQGRFAI